MPTHPLIPYGRADFKKIRLEGCLYVDKTRFVRRIEAERHVFFIRPRRFGKTCWLALLECYYDRTEKEDFERVFAGTDIGRDPTANRSRYVVLFFDFSAIRKALETLEQRFEEYCHRHIENAMERNPDLFPEAERRRVLAAPGTGGKLDQLFIYARDRGIPLYVMIDEYANFANTILAQDGADAYRDAEAFAVDLYALERMMYAMAYRGAWRPVLEFLADAIARQTGIRDYIAGEKVLHGFLAAYMGIAECFLFRSERELNGGYADICLEPFLAGHPQMRHGYLIELKYLKRGAGNAQAVEAAARQAGAQLRQYLADEALASQYPSVRFTGIALVFHGWEMAFCDAVAGDGNPGQARMEAS